MEALFTYGTLMSASVRRSLLRRDVAATPAVLPGWKKDRIRIGGTVYPAIVPGLSGAVPGLVFEVSPEELIELDAYETEAYHRKKITLQDGRSAWVYVRA